MQAGLQPPATAVSTNLPKQTLLFDADDTLWENNIYFEAAIDRFVDLVAHPELSPSQVREAFNQFEATRVTQHGYGTGAFHASLLASFAHLTGAPCTAEQAASVNECAGHVRNGAMVLLTDVATTLARLASKHTLLLVTKGDHAEQTGKLLRSGLGPHFTHVEVLHEKDLHAYRALLARHTLDPLRTWMIGNSPRSDINPALAAGMSAVYVPHPSTWVLEQEALAKPLGGSTLLHVARFANLLDHFA